ncbi:MAG: Fe-S cluster protein [Dehalococcoidia bacterium]|nr:Fe-S cluster protein [Dehalococcoidia bacterium]
MMLLQNYKVTNIRRNHCNPEWISVSAELGDDISQVLPYLNAVIKNAVYTPEVPNLNFKIERGAISLTPQEMRVGQVTCEEDATKVLDYVKELINNTWEKRESITPIYERKESIKAKDILDFLPKTNCRDCGLPTCFAFAMALTNGRKHLEECSVLGKPELIRDREALARLLQTVRSQEVIK